MHLKDWAIFTLAKRQHGVFTYAQARMLGFSRGAMRCRLRDREWLPMLKGVARLYWSEDDWLTRCHAVMQWAGDGALSHVTAAQLLGFDVEPSKLIHFATRSRKLKSRWAHCHRSPVRDSVRVGALRVTPPARTAYDLSLLLDQAELERVLRVAVRSGLLSTSSLCESVAHANGRKGVAFRTAFNELVRAK